MLTSADVATWLGTQLPTVKVLPGGYSAQVPPTPDQLVIVSYTGGPGLAYEQTFDQLSFQTRVRGDQNDPGSAEALAWQVDAAFVDAVFPTTIAARYVLRMTRLSGTPRFLVRDSARRINLTSDYLVVVAR